MQYEWDAAKNRANLAKHGIDFADAVAVFEDDLALTRSDTTARGESRFATLGVDGFGRHLVVVFYRAWHAHPHYLCTCRDENGAKIL
jgi:uncharacterized DUF497 family protein